ncbi:RNA polymerase sigma factor [Paenibacillus allorhizosphaerae]|uniref:RNA polymerase sigma factor n=1 Tax=Paenibacillus allorhizosphaerae TaxID=2849866 RepID=A0ABM8VE75_9BACL|nr:RNA polymerase sigma factor [Paenibacillus allorhizosphaerae]CAG7630465.1 hypothetical protein PAECIP111802_01639 [Paenibacillus allorhizosphaerae]
MTIHVFGSASHAEDQSRFTALIEPYRAALQAYCRSIAHSSWEADDLVQDTWLKAYKMFLRQPARSDMSKTYLFRIAHNTWIDRCRKRRHAADSLGDEQNRLPEETVDPVELRNAMETLVASLPARQRVLLLLVDTFGYTASEAAQLIRSTEGAVKAVLHRARAKLKSLSSVPAESPGEQATTDGRIVDEHIVYAYLQAFRQHNPHALVRLLNEETQTDCVSVVTGSLTAGGMNNEISMNPQAPLSMMIHSSRMMAA